MCNMDCFNCPFDDCVNDEITDIENINQDKLDAEIYLDGMFPKQRYMYERNHSDKGRESQRKYRKSEKGKEANRRSNHSESSKVSHKKYRQSEKGKKSIERYNSSEKAKQTRKRYRSSERAKELNRIWQREYRLRKKQAAAN